MKLCGLFFRLKCLLAISCLIVSCGKKAQNAREQSPAQQRTDPVVTDIEEQLSKQLILCEEGEVCPDNIVKIVVFEKKVAKTCTGFLVNENTVATSANCLPQLLRLKDQDCSTDVYFFLPQSNGRPSERIGCSKVLMVSELNGKEAALWRDDVAYLGLKEPAVLRRSFVINREGFENQKDYTYWAVEQQIDGKTAFIRRKTCQALHNSYVNPLSSKSTSPNMLFSGCEIKDGSTGAPVLDALGGVRGVISQNMSESVRAYLKGAGLLTGELKQMFHASNFSCAPSIFDSQVEDHIECLKVMDQSVLDKMRQELLSREDGYEEKRVALETKLSNESKFLNFSVKLVADGDLRRAEVIPRCFKNISKWINTLNTSRGNYAFETSYPQIGFKRTMDLDGRIGMAAVDNGEFEFVLQFSAKNLRKTRKSAVHFWYGENGHTVFEAIPEC